MSAEHTFRASKELEPEMIEILTPLRADSLKLLEQQQGAAAGGAGASIRCFSDEGTESVGTTPGATSNSEDDDGSDRDDVLSDLGEESVHGGKLFSALALNAPLPGRVVLVTGGAGFVGSHTADALLARGDSVVLVDEFNDYYDVRLKRSNVQYLMEKYGRGRIKVIEADICDAHAMEQIFIVDKPRLVVHMAARAGVRPSIDDPFVYIHSNMLGTTRLLELARIHGNDCFVWASSSSVYGGSMNEEFHEDDLVDKPVSPYAATKKACELMTYTYHSLYGMNVSGLRFFTVYGPRGRPDMAPFKFVDRVSRGLEIQQFGDGSSSRDYTYIDDIVDGIIRALDRPLGYQIFNLGNGSPYRLSDFISLVEKNVGKQAIIKVLPDQPGDVPRTCADISKARELLGYEPKVSFEEGIKRTVEWYQQWQAEEAAMAAMGSAPSSPKAGVKGTGKGKGGRMKRAGSVVSVMSLGV